MFYMHSMCCDAHWELVWTEQNGYDLQCELCGRPIGGTFELLGLPPVGCDTCAERLVDGDDPISGKEESDA